MNTRSLIDYVKRVAPSWTRMDILNFINDAQNAVFGVPVESMKYKDTVNGGDKILTTVDGTLVYELSASNFGADIQFIQNVYPINDTEGTYGSTSYNNNIVIDTRDGIQGTMAKILFSENPGVTEYHIECYEYPDEVASESSLLSIPESAVIPYFYQGVVGMIEILEHGQSNAYDTFLNVGINEIRNIMNTTGHTLIHYTEGGGY
jgi:hypothetical protein